MIISHVYGGLGNQMFQYAAGFRLAKKYNTTLLLDISDFYKYPDRKFDLDCFRISGTVMTLDPDLVFIDQGLNPIKRAARSILAGVHRKHRISYIREPYYHYYPALGNAPNPCYIDGYWQSEKYFAEIRNDILREFSLRSPVSDTTREIADGMEECTPVSIHIRRGDYVTNKDANTFHGLCSLSYYHHAILLLKERVNDPVFYIFSDDPQWTEKNLKIPGRAQYVTHNGGCAHEDLYLMSRCRHHIIANSSFSWWGAWMAESKDQTVITPNPWYNYPDYCYDDIIPGRWIKISKTGNDDNKNFS